MKYSIRFASSSIASLALKKQEFEVGSLLAINIPYHLWKKKQCSISHDLSTAKIQFLEYT